MTNKTTTVIHHSADFDGLFCREIARKFLPDAELIGWDFGHAPVMPPTGDGRIYVMDLPLFEPFGTSFEGEPIVNRMVWIDHHKSSMEKYSNINVSGYRIDGVAACRLAWQWFRNIEVQKDEDDARKWPGFSEKQDFVDRKVEEPLAVRLVGEQDIWDKRDPRAELFQHGLRSRELTREIWDQLLVTGEDPEEDPDYDLLLVELLYAGESIQYAKTQENAAIIKRSGFTMKWEGLTWLACNHAMFNSHLFTAGIKPEHDALIGFRFDGKKYAVSLYHAPGYEQHDLSKIAVKYGGGGHNGACGFGCEKLPW